MEYPMKVSVPRSTRAHMRGLIHKLWITICVASLLAGCAQQSSHERRPMHTLAVRPLYSRAVEIAKAWRSDAYLVSIDAPVAQESEGLFRAFFYFLSPSSDFIMLQVTYNSATGEWQDDWLSAYRVDRGRYPEIKDWEWQVDSTEALEVASRSGGSDFIEANPSSHLYVSLSLERQDALGVVWSVRYSDVYTKELCVVVDARTGEVVSKECRHP